MHSVVKVYVCFNSDRLAHQSYMYVSIVSGKHTKVICMFNIVRKSTLKLCIF